MKTKIKIITVLSSLFAACLVLGACSTSTGLDKYIDNGYVVIVTYDGNGGKFIAKEGTKIIDAFDPNKYQADENGTVHISLVEPTKRELNHESVSLTKAGNFIVGWYTERTIKTNASGEAVDVDGVVITKEGDGYVYSDGKSATPAYVYGGYWDFETSTIDYTLGSGVKEMTLYACWAPYFEFEYYYMSDDGEWKLAAKTNFDYKTTNAVGSASSDRDTIFLPEYVDGAMTYKHRYSDGGIYNFPHIENTTFTGAYLDEDLTTPIEGATFEHRGTVDYATGVSVNNVEKIYFTYEKGVKYLISTADEFVSNADTSGIYEVMCDLDFTAEKWPAIFTMSEFTGAIRSATGEPVAFKNVKATFTSLGSPNGGLFASIGDQAVIENVTFENITTDISACQQRLMNGNFALFAGFISEDANLSGVTVKGENKLMVSGQLPFDQTSFSLGSVLLSVTANGAYEKVDFTGSAVTLEFYVYTKLFDGNGFVYEYWYDPQEAIVSDDGSVTLRFGTFKLESDTYECEFVESFTEQTEEE